MLRMVYFADFHAVMSYCLLIWGHSAIAQRIFALQRKAVRIVGGAGYRDDCKTLFISLKIMTLPSLYVFRCVQYINKHINQYTVSGVAHGYNTRNKEDIECSYGRINRSRSGVNYWGTKFFNRLPTSVRRMTSKTFDQKVKMCLLENPLYNKEEFLKANLF